MTILREGPAGPDNPSMQVATFEDVAARVRAGERLGRDDGIFLYRHPDLDAVRALANEVSERRNGRDVTYVVNRHINYSNLCRLSCFVCAFAKKRGDQ